MLAVVVEAPAAVFGLQPAAIKIFATQCAHGPRDAEGGWLPPPPIFLYFGGGSPPLLMFQTGGRRPPTGFSF